MRLQDRRLGRFLVGRELFDDNVAEYAFRALRFPLEVRYRFDIDGVEVLAVSEHFAEVPIGSEAPWYDLRIEGDRVWSNDLENPGWKTSNFHAIFEKRS